jgi:hypothetical protein
VLRLLRHRERKREREFGFERARGGYIIGLRLERDERVGKVLEGFRVGALWPMGSFFHSLLLFQSTRRPS